MAHKWVITVALAFLGIFLHANASFSEDKSKNVDILFYYNSGGYTVDYVQVFWKKDGVEKRRKWAGDLTIGKAFCADLNKVDGLDEGSEVWLKFKISGGDKESCRKSEKMIFVKSKFGDTLEFYYSKGTTLNGNRCRKSKPPTQSLVSPGTGNCKASDYWPD